MKQIISILLFAVFFQTHADAQPVRRFNISGTIISKNTLEPIKKSNTIIASVIAFSETGGVACDSLGHFTIFKLPEGKYKLTLYANGYYNTDTVVTVKDTDITNFNFLADTNCLTKEIALRDIKNQKAKIYVNYNRSTNYYADSIFSKKYHIRYIYYCPFEYAGIGFGNVECVDVYNQAIFEYLDTIYPALWRWSINQDAVGLQSYLTLYPKKAPYLKQDSKKVNLKSLNKFN